MANTVTYNKHDYVAKLRARLNKPTSWMDTMNVRFSNNRTIVNSRISTEPGVQTGTRGTAYGYTDFALTDDTLTISTKRIIPMFIDQADLFQQSYLTQMETADFQGKKINEHLESAVLAQHANWTDFGAGDLANTSTDDTAQITVSATNIDDLVRAIKRKINANDGVEAAVERGVFVVWRASDYELLEGFAQANGFSEADVALKNGVPVGMRYLGVDHFLSNSHTANHLFAGVKKSGDLGILSGTYGQVKFIEDPNLQSGLGIVSRVDYGFAWPGGNLAELSIDVNVA